MTSKKLSIKCPACKIGYWLRDPDRVRKVRCKKCLYVFNVGKKNQIKISTLKSNKKSLELTRKLPFQKFNDPSQTLKDFLKEGNISVDIDLHRENEDFVKSGESRYIVGKEIARGGMGSILDTRDINLRRNVVTKILHNIQYTDDVIKFVEEAQINDITTFT